ncbi:hypothetical protein GKE62_17560 [Novosphingobium sp. Gsoil 351]|nr:hypothetical protein GKE62_17560 [Novosphingobium sp. Gsoil 351]
MAAVAAAVLGIAAWYAAIVEPPRGVQGIVHSVPVPEPPVNRNKPLTPEQALAANAALPPSTEPVEPAPAFAIPKTAAGELSRESALDCLTAAVYFEAASETLEGQRAVAQVVLNRVRHPAFPKSVCGVVYQGSERRTGCQFTFTCDGSLARRPSPRAWQLATAVAAAALGGSVERSVGMATHYHTVWVVPYWADSLSKIGVVGAHIFYRWRGFWGRRTAFTGHYVGEDQTIEEIPAPLASDGQATGLPDQIGSAVAPLPRLLADQHSGQLTLPSEAAQKAPLAADGDHGGLIADDARGVLTSEEHSLRAKP